MPAPKIAFRRVDALTPDPRNARTHDDAQVRQIADSIRRFGWTQPILADELIRAGHGRRAAAQLIYAAGERIHMAPGPKNGGAIVPDGQVPVIDCTGWSEDERRAYALADNRIAENAGWDTGILRGELDALISTDFDIAAIGFDQDAIDTLIPMTDPTLPGRSAGTEADSTYQHVDQFAVIVRCATEAEQEVRFNALRDTYGADNVKVVTV